MSQPATPHSPLPAHRDLRISDAEREFAVSRLQTALTEGRLTLDEFTERVDKVLGSRTYGEIEPYFADLPAAAITGPLAPRDVLQLRSGMGSVRRRGRWDVPRRLEVRSKFGRVKLDFTDAAIIHPVVEIDLDVAFGETILVLPPSASVNADAVRMLAGELKVRRLETRPSLRGPHFVVTGVQHFGSLIIRPQRHFLRWRW